MNFIDLPTQRLTRWQVARVGQVRQKAQVAARQQAQVAALERAAMVALVAPG
jgi:hypothetical protein